MTRASWIIVAATISLSNIAGAGEWPQFRGPNSSGIGDGKPPVEFGPSQNVLWKTAVGSGLSSPIIAKGRVLLTEFDRATNQLATLCIDQRTGKILWRRTVAPAEIENCLLQHEAVLECAVVGHEADGLVKPKAFIVAREGFETTDQLVEDIKQFVKDNIAVYKYPRWVEFVDSLPKNDRGKIDRKKLKT